MLAGDNNDPNDYAALSKGERRFLGAYFRVQEELSIRSRSLSPTGIRLNRRFQDRAMELMEKAKRISVSAERSD